MLLSKVVLYQFVQEYYHVLIEFRLFGKIVFLYFIIFQNSQFITDNLIDKYKLNLNKSIGRFDYIYIYISNEILTVLLIYK